MKERKDLYIKEKIIIEQYENSINIYKSLWNIFAKK